MVKSLPALTIHPAKTVAPPFIKASAITFIMMALLFSLKGMAQTNPNAQPLPYTQNFGTASFSNLPAGIASWRFGRVQTKAAAEASNPSADQAITARTSTTNTTGSYGYVTASNARFYIQTGTSNTNGNNQLVMAINTGSYNDVQISYSVEVLNNPGTNREAGLILQYRRGTSGGWTSIPASEAAIVSNFATRTYSVIVNDLLSSNVYQFRWVTWVPNVGNGNNKFKGIGIDNIVARGVKITTGNLTPSTVCVNQTTGGALSVPFSSEGSFNSGNIYQAELSNSSGSFTSPTLIGSLTSTANSGTINATIPANTPSGSNYKVRVIATNPSVNGVASTTSLNIVNAYNSIAPTAVQNINVNQDGTALNCTDNATPVSRQWMATQTSGSGYSAISGATGISYTPNGSTQGNYYVVCQSTYAGCGSVISNEVRVNVFATVTTGNITGSPFCVTKDDGATVSVPFTSAGTFSSNTYTAQLSNASGSFASPVNIGTLTSNANSGVINATIPANTPYGTGYRIRVISSNPAVTGTPNTINLTINLRANSIAPAATQNININANGTAITCTDATTPTSRQWAYSTTSGGPYTNISGATAASYTPNFSVQGTLYLVCRSNYSTCGTVISNEVQINVNPTIATGSITPAPFCVTMNEGKSINVPYTIQGSFTANTFTAQLSNASGSFASPINIGSLVSNTSGTINAVIPAETPSGTGYRVRVIASNPAITGTDNGTNLNIALAGNSIAPTAVQNIEAATNAAALTCTDLSTPISRQWAYATTSGGPYTNFSAATGASYAPSFASQGKYFVVCKSTYNGCGVITSNEVEINVRAVVTTGTISGSPFCVTATTQRAVNVPYTTKGSILPGNIFTAELSNSTGSFTSPVVIGSLTSTASSGTIAANIPAGTPTGTGYRIRVVSSNPAVEGSANATNLTINLSANSIAPIAEQTLNINSNGTTLTCTEQSAVSGRQWAYSTSPGGPYTNIAGATALTYTPNFSSFGVFYVVCRSTFTACGGVITSNEVKINVTATLPPSITGFSPASGAQGTTVTITGDNFYGATAVSFGGVAATSFTVVNTNTITAVVGPGASGSVSVTTPKGTNSRAGFDFEPLNAIYSDFNGFWSTEVANINPIRPNDSHNFLGFNFSGVTYSTGVNDNILSNNGVTFTPGNWRSAPIAGLTGIVSSTNILLAVGSVKDGDPINGVASSPAIKDLTIRDVLRDGPRGLDLGTGVTNLPSSAVMQFNINSMDPSRFNDAEPDILITQIAAPTGSIDSYAFLDANGNVVGNSITRAQTTLPILGIYKLDLFNLVSGEQLTTAKVNGSLFETPGGTREIRMAAYRLSEFGITPSNYSQIKTLQIIPSGTSDIAFIAYNANSMNFKPTVMVDEANTITNACGGGTAYMQVLAAAANDGNLIYSWQRSTNGGSTWSTITDNASFSGTTTERLAAIGPAVGTKFRVVVTESNTGYSTISDVFTTSTSSYPAPTIITQPDNKTACIDGDVTLFVKASGGTGIYGYQWQKRNPSMAFTDVADATAQSFAPPTNATGSSVYRVIVSNLGCSSSIISNEITVTINGGGALSVSSATRCDAGRVTLTANAPGSTSINWFEADGTQVFSGTSFQTPTLSATKNYYVIANYNTPSCQSKSVTTTATIVNTPIIVSVKDTFRCGNGIVNLNATASGGSAVWYSIQTGGSPIYTGSNYSPSIASTATFYVEANDRGCITANRKPVVGTVKPIPTIGSSTGNSICGAGTVSLNATSPTGTVNWYDQPTGGSSLYVGNTYAPTVSNTTNFYVDATLNGCTTINRTLVTATVKPIPVISSVTDASICGPGQATLQANPSAGTVNWYNVPTGGTSIATGSIYTPNVSATTNYYTDASFNGCTTASRTLVKATVNAIPSISSVMSNARCGAGVINLTANASVGSVQWYSAAIGGSLLSSGSTYSPNVSSSTTYYVQANNNGCLSTARSAVTATVDALNTGTVSFSGIDSICYMQESRILTLNGSSGTVDKWQQSLNGTSWNDIVNTNLNYTISNLAAPTYFRAVVNGGTCGTGNSATAFLKIKVCEPVLPDPNPSVPPLITAGNYQYYKRDSAFSLEANSAPGAQLHWYTQPTGGTYTTTPPIPSTNSVGVYTYYVSQFAAGMESNRVKIIVEVKPITWFGGGGTEWETSSSWRGGRPPLYGDEVIIENNPVTPPTLDNDITIGKLFFGTGDSSFVRMNAKKLVILDSIIGNSIFDGDSLATLEIKGAASNIITFKQNGKQLENFIIDHSGADIKLGSNLDIYGVFSVASGSFDLNGDTLALKAGVYPQTGMVGNTNGDVHQSNGLFLVERFMPARRAYRLLSASVNSVNPIIDNWQEGVHNTTRIYSSNLDPHPGFGTHITGSKNGANGFDATRSGNPSMFTYNNDAGTWHAIANTNATYLVAGQPYRIIVRGDRSIDMNTNTPAPTNTILRSWGTILQGNQTKPLSSTAGQFNMIGNPYAAAVNLADVTKVNASDIIYIWDPNMQNSETATSIGAYVTYDLSTGISTMEDESEVNQYLQPGQGFFIQTIANGPASLTFKESDKYTDGTTQTFKTSNAGLSKIQVKLYVDTLNAKASDGCAIVFNGNYSNDAVTGEDGFKLSNSFENISMLVGNNKLSINKRSYPVSSDTIMLNLTGYTSGNYRLHINATNVVLGGMNAFLVDAYTQTETPLDMINENVIAFDINNSIAASKAADRFMIVFKQGTTLPVSFIQISAKNEDEKNVVLWRATQQEPVTVFEVERSADGKKFEKIGSVKPQQSESYRFDDNGFLTGKNYYRVKVKSVEGKEKYSSVVVVNNSGERKGEMSIYPNPVVGRKMNIGMKQVAAGEYRIMIINGAGQNVWQSTLNYNGEATKTIQLPSSIVPGMYSVKIMSKENEYILKMLVD